MVRRVFESQDTNVSISFTNAQDAGVTQERQAKVAEHVKTKEDRVGDLQLASEADRITWHFLLLRTTVCSARWIGNGLAIHEERHPHFEDDNVGLRQLPQLCQITLLDRAIIIQIKYRSVKSPRKSGSSNPFKSRIIAKLQKQQPRQQSDMLNGDFHRPSEAMAIV